MNDDTLLPFDLPSVRRKKLTVDFAGGHQSSDGGLLLLREAERKLGVCRRLAAAMPDRRDPDRVRHAMFEMVMLLSLNLDARDVTLDESPVIGPPWELHPRFTSSARAA